MSPRRRLSLLEDEELLEVSGRDETSDYDICGDCDCVRANHGEKGCKCGKCKEFVE